jgi:hypothetical protein
MKQAILAAAIASIALVPAQAQSVRDILSFQFDGVFEGDVDMRVENAIIVPLNPFFSLEAHVWYEDLGQSRRAIVQPGAVFVLGYESWIEVLYGIGFGTDGTLSHEAYADLNLSFGPIATAAAIKFSYFQADGYWYAVPSLGLAFPIGDHHRLSFKLYGSVNSYMRLGGSLFASDTMSLGGSWFLTLGATFGLEDRATGTAAPNAFLAVAGCALGETSSIRFGVEYLGAALEPTAIRFITVLDARF